MSDVTPTLVKTETERERRQEGVRGGVGSIPCDPFPTLKPRLLDTPRVSTGNRRSTDPRSVNDGVKGLDGVPLLTLR